MKRPVITKRQMLEEILQGTEYCNSDYIDVLLRNRTDYRIHESYNHYLQYRHNQEAVKFIVAQLIL